MVSIKYIYCTDSVLDCADKDTIAITRESLDQLNVDLGAWTPVNASQIPSPSKTSTAKASPSKHMDAEKRGE
jgi:hypothetical protein